VFGIEQYNNGSNIPSHKVNKGETLFAVARKYNISIHELAKSNGWTYKNGTMLDAKGRQVNIKPGMSILIAGTPAQEPPTQAPPPSKPEAIKPKETPSKVYTVKKGDNLMDIANAKNISIRQLAAANGWSVAKVGDTLGVLKNGKNVVLQLGQKINIPKPVTNIKTLKSMDDVLKNTGTSRGFLDIIKKFEGNPNNNYTPYKKAYKDDSGTWTIGFGETAGVKPTTEWTNDKIYTNLAKRLLQNQEDLRIELGDEVWNKMPQSLKEGALDLIYNKGFEALDVQTFKEAVSKGDYSKALRALIYKESIKDGKEYNGLYKRSLARLAHVYNGLKGEAKINAKSVVDNLYQQCAERGIKEIENWWEAPNTLQTIPKLGAEKNVIDSTTSTPTTVLTPEQKIHDELIKTLSEDDDLTAVSYQNYIKQINHRNVIEILQDGKIIDGICEAENDRTVCKAEIMRLFDILRKHYKLDKEKKDAFLELVNKEFRERYLATPSTWWIGTSDIVKSFKQLIATAEDVNSVVYKELGLNKDNPDVKDLNFDGQPIKSGQIFKPTKEGLQNGELRGKRIVINAGHGGPNPNNKFFDVGAVNTEYNLNEWMINLYMAKKVIPELQAKGAEVIITFGHVDAKNIRYVSHKEDLLISLHADSHGGTSGPRIYAEKKDRKDKNLANHILKSFINNENTDNVVDLNWAEKTYDLDYQYNDVDSKEIQAKIVSRGTKQILRKDNRTPSDAPSVLIEYCNMANSPEVCSLVCGNLGNDIIESIVKGIVKYWEITEQQTH